MKLVLIFLGISIIFLSCYNQPSREIQNIDMQKGVLMFFLDEPVFFAIEDTTLKKISASKIYGLSLGKITYQDVYESISSKRRVQYYISENQKIDTVNSLVKLLLVSLTTRTLQSKLTADTLSFGFNYAGEHLAFPYMIRFDKEIVSIELTNKSDRKLFNKYLDKKK